jgi:dienelactone hydrolase
MRKIKLICSAMAVAVASFSPTDSSALNKDVVTLSPRPGVTMKVVVQRPAEAPRASLVLFEGGPGKISGSSESGGLLVEHQEAFTKKGFVTALVDAPSDRANGLLGGFRLSGQHLTDIRAVVDHLREKESIPVWLVGISLGTQSAAYAGVHLSDQIGGIVLLSSKTRPQPVGKPITELKLGQIRVPVLIGTHASDNCPGTPPSGAQEVAKALVNSPKAVVQTFTGGRSKSGDPCTPGGYHTFTGLEPTVIDAVSAFISEQTVARSR